MHGPFDHLIQYIIHVNKVTTAILKTINLIYISQSLITLQKYFPLYKSQSSLWGGQLSLRQMAKKQSQTNGASQDLVLRTENFGLVSCSQTDFLKIAIRRSQMFSSNLLFKKPLIPKYFLRFNLLRRLKLIRHPYLQKW